MPILPDRGGPNAVPSHAEHLRHDHGAGAREICYRSQCRCICERDHQPTAPDPLVSAGNGVLPHFPGRGGGFLLCVPLPGAANRGRSFDPVCDGDIS